MSKYLDALRSSRPEHLYVFDLDRATLDGGTVTDSGSEPVNGTIVESPGNAVLEVVPGLIPGTDYSVHFNVVHDRSVNDAELYYSRVEVPDLSKSLLTEQDNWTAELVVQSMGHVRSRYDEAAELSNHDGLSFERADDNNRKFVLRIQTTDELVTIAESGNISHNTPTHIVVQRANNTFSLVVNGTIVGSKAVANVASTLVDDLYIGGVDSHYHTDSSVAVVALWSRTLSGKEVSDHYNKFVERHDKDLLAESLTPIVSVVLDDETRTGTSEPFYRNLSDRVDSSELYENGSGELMLQPSVLAVGVTKSKQLAYDVSEFTAGISSYLGYTATTDANSSLDVYYSVDGDNFYAWTQGEDNIPEINAFWGGVV